VDQHAADVLRDYAHFAEVYLKIPRVTFAVALLAVAALAQSAAVSDQPYRHGPNNAITDVPGVKVGHYTDPRTPRGTTVVIPGEAGGICAADAAGGDPLDIEVATFAPTTLAEECDAIVLTGGSAFGLSTAAGVVNHLYEHGHGVKTLWGRVPIVPAAVIFDLPVGDATIHPTPAWGYKAAAAATTGAVQQGNVGAGAGGTVGKSPGGIPLKGGLGTASFVLPGGVVVGAVVALNSLGDVVNPATGELYATSGGFDRALFRRYYVPPKQENVSSIQNTTIAIIATNAKLTKTQLTKVAQLAHDGLARAIRPVHSMLDGDTIFVVSVGGDKRIEIKPTSFAGEEVDIVGGAAGDVLVQAILNGMQAAQSIPGWTSYSDWKKARETKR
jgi:L-aminopeptidase/D-esterase-like protein